MGFADIHKKAARGIFLNDRVILLAIIINTFVIFTNGSISDSLWLNYLDVSFTVFFLIEAIVKIGVLGWKCYWSEGWNRFDFIVVMMALPSIGNLFGDMSIGMNVVLVFRTLRIFKSLLLFRYVPHISGIIHGVKQAVRSSILVCLAFMVFLLVLSILTSELFGRYAPQYFASPSLSIYSLFRLFTIEGWYEMPEAIVATGGHAMGVFARLYFSLLLFAGGIIGMSLVNSIFVDAMVADNNDEVLKKLDSIEKELKELKEQSHSAEEV